MADAGESLVGAVGRIIFQNKNNGYTVFTLNTGGREETCVGFFPELTEGSVIEAFGEFTTHQAYGKQFKVERYEFHVPETKEAVESYLGSGAIKGIGRALAKRIVDKFGEDAIRILEEEPERLAEVKGISRRGARELGAEAAKKAGMRRAMMFLEGYGITGRTGVKIYNAYGDDLYGILKENPYRLAEDIEGIGFVTADRIAARIGIPEDSEYRIRSGILYVLAASSAEGHVYLPESMLVSRASEILGADPERVGDELENLIFDRKVISKDIEETDPAGGESTSRRVIYAAVLYYMELDCARLLVDLCEPSGISRKEALAEIRKTSSERGISLEEEQEQAVVMAAVYGLTVLTGGPGTGKTTTINAMIRYFRSRGMKVLLAAPTGRAAKRMKEMTGHEARTIHRLLEISSSVDDDERSMRFERNAENPLEADAVIIDEMSMVDIYLMHALLDAVSPGTHLVLVGDVDQLPSVGPGSVLKDIISSDAFPVVRLTKIFRQSESSDIIVNAHKINRGEQISLDNRSSDFFFLRRDDPDLMIRNMIGLIRDRLPRYVHAKPFDIQVLAPMRKGPLGVVHLNEVLQKYLNPPSPGKREKIYGDRLFRVGDKVMQTRNNYELDWSVPGKYSIPVERGTGIFNGDLGCVKDVDEFAHTMTVEFDDRRIVEYPFLLLDDLDLAYAVTIHKSQGSEYPAVILPLLTGPRMLMTRNLLYTAVTRARSCVVILGSDATVRSMIENESEQKRYTSLDLRIRELCTSGIPETDI